MKSNYHRRRNPVLHGDIIKHHHNPTGILVDMALRLVKYNIIKRQRNGS